MTSPQTSKRCPNDGAEERRSSLVVAVWGSRNLEDACPITERGSLSGARRWSLVDFLSWQGRDPYIVGMNVKMMMRNRRSAPSFCEAGGGICSLVFLGVWDQWYRDLFWSENHGVEWGQVRCAPYAGLWIWYYPGSGICLCFGDDFYYLGA